MVTFGRSTAYAIFCLAVLSGGGPLMAFLVFLLAGSPELVSLNLRANEVLWWDTGLCIAFFIQHSRMVRRSFRQWKMHWSLRGFFLFADRHGGAFLWHAQLTPAIGGKIWEINGMDLVIVNGDRMCRNEVYFDRTVLFSDK